MQLKNNNKKEDKNIQMCSFLLSKVLLIQNLLSLISVQNITNLRAERPTSQSYSLHQPSSNAVCHTLLVQMNRRSSSWVFTNILSREVSVISVSSPSAAASPGTRQSPSEQEKLKAALSLSLEVN